MLYPAQILCELFTRISLNTFLCCLNQLEYILLFVAESPDNYGDSIILVKVVSSTQKGSVKLYLKPLAFQVDDIRHFTAFVLPKLVFLFFMLKSI